jgi:hypothetical protein
MRIYFCIRKSADTDIGWIRLLGNVSEKHVAVDNGWIRIVFGKNGLPKPGSRSFFKTETGNRSNNRTGFGLFLH